MTATFAALLFIQIIADYALQSDAMANDKGRPRHLLGHGAILLALTLAVLGPGALIPGLILTAAHLGIDLFRADWVARRQNRLGPFLTDQAAHLMTLALAAAALPGLWLAGPWTGQGWAPAAMTLIAGALLATRGGGFAIGMLMQRFEGVKLPRGLPEGGWIIGHLERGLIYILILAGQSGGVGFLIAAKSVLRFDATSRNQRAGEYVIIGTLASFGWAIATGYAALWLLAQLPGIGIPAPAP